MKTGYITSTKFIEYKWELTNIAVNGVKWAVLTKKDIKI